MGNRITISSNNFNGELVNILFKPYNQDITINLGDVNIPYSFDTTGIIPPCEVYGTYTILVKDSECSFLLNVAKPTPTPTPTPSVTPTNTPTPTPTPTMTSSPNPCLLITPTPTSSPLP
jgi:hypothetical protein